MEDVRLTLMRAFVRRDAEAAARRVSSSLSEGMGRVDAMLGEAEASLRAALARGGGDGR